MSEIWIPRNEQQLANLCAMIRHGWTVNKTFTLEIRPERRSDAQNNALHTYLGNLSFSLNEAGLDMRVVMKPEVELPWTKENAKNNLWRPLQRAMYGVESTKQPTKTQYPKIYETLNRHLVTKFGQAAYVEWPSKTNKGK